MKLNKILTVVFSLIASIVNSATFYVDANATGSNNGTSWENAYTSISRGIALSAAGSILIVTNGVYTGTISSANKAITIQSLNGPLYTTITAGAAETPLTLGSRSTHKSTVFTGFTIKTTSMVINGFTYGAAAAVKYGTLNRCIIKDSLVSSYLTYYTTMNNCLIIDNISQGNYMLATPVLYNCTVTRNSCTSSYATSSGGTYNGTIYNSIVYGNTAVYSAAINNYYGGTYAYSCTFPAKTGTGNISTTPIFVGIVNEDARQRTGSPTLNVGLNTNAKGTEDLWGSPRIQDTTVDMGCMEGVVDGWIIFATLEGQGGTLSSLLTIVPVGGVGVLTATEINRPFGGFYTNSVLMTMDKQIVIDPMTADFSVAAKFNTSDMYVDAENGDDSRLGTSWSLAKKTIQAGINNTYPGDTVWVTNGVYEPIYAMNQSISIKSINGYKHTVIDGGFTNICAMLHRADSGMNKTNTVLEGFTLINGNGYKYLIPDYYTKGTAFAVNVAGGVMSGTINKCYIINCKGYTAGAAEYSNLNNCVMNRNYGKISAVTSFCDLRNCTAVGNYTVMQDTTKYSSLKNSIVTGTILRGKFDIWCRSAGPTDYSAIDNPPGGIGTGNINAAVGNMFLLSEYGDGRFTSTNSRAINAGYNQYVVGDTDIDGNPRIQDGTVDMGAYESVITNGVVIIPILSGVGAWDDYSVRFLSPVQDNIFSVRELGRPFLGFYTNGVFATTNMIFVWNEAVDRSTIEARFDTATVYVSPLRPDDNGDGLSWSTAKKTLQGGLNVSKDGDVVVVDDGVYSLLKGEPGPIDVIDESNLFNPNKDATITIKSLNGAYKSIIDLSGMMAPGILFDSSAANIYDSTLEQYYNILDGFMIKNLNSDACVWDGGILKNCVIRDNVSSTLMMQNVKLYNCLIISNKNTSASGTGGGLQNGLSHNSIFIGNSAYLGGATYNSELVSCLVISNTASYRYGGCYSGSIYNTLVTQNKAGQYGGGGNGTWKNSIVWNNTLLDEVTISNHDNTPKMTYMCTIPYKSGTGNITNDPQFVNSVIGDFRFKSNSPCINKGSIELYPWETNGTDFNGEPRVRGNIVDIGLIEFFYNKLPSDISPMGDSHGKYNQWLEISDTGVKWNFDGYNPCLGNPYYSIFDDVQVFRSATSALIKNPARELVGTWRHAVTTNLISKFVSAKVEEISIYKYHRDTPYADPGISSWTHPNCFQLYETNGINTNAHDPRTVNQTFFWAELADALVCQSSWRGDWYAHRPYIVVSPHYAVSAEHFDQTNVGVPFCTNRLTQAFMVNQLATNIATSGRIGSHGDISVHRFNTEFPSNLFVNVLRQSVLTNMSPSMLSKSIGVMLSSHNTVHPMQLTACNSYKEEPNALNSHQGWDWFDVSWDVNEWMDGLNYYDLGKETHATHLYDSGHGVFFWINGKLVLVGTFTVPEGGRNTFLNDATINALNLIIETHSGGTESLQELQIGDLQ